MLALKVAVTAGKSGEVDALLAEVVAMVNQGLTEGSGKGLQGSFEFTMIGEESEDSTS